MFDSIHVVFSLSLLNPVILTVEDALGYGFSQSSASLSGSHNQKRGLGLVTFQTLTWPETKLNLLLIKFHSNINVSNVSNVSEKKNV